MAAALTLVALPATAQTPAKEKCFGVSLKGQNDWRRWRRHHLRRHFQDRLSGQCLEICSGWHLRVDEDAIGDGQPDGNQGLRSLKL